MSAAESNSELLELAAKAAGYQLSAVSDMIWSDAAVEYIPRTPLTDDGDALRLAVTLRMVIHHAKKYVVVMDVEKETAHHEDVRDNGGDAFAATRRAIVRAAAEIGRSM